MSRAPERLCERDKVMHEMASLIQMIDQDAETLAPHVAEGGREGYESLQTSAKRLGVLFHALRGLLGPGITMAFLLDSYSVRSSAARRAAHPAQTSAGEPSAFQAMPGRWGGSYAPGPASCSTPLGWTRRSRRRMP
jgi:hypothetical protein